MSKIGSRGKYVTGNLIRPLTTLTVGCYQGHSLDFEVHPSPGCLCRLLDLQVSRIFVNVFLFYVVSDRLESVLIRCRVKGPPALQPVVLAVDSSGWHVAHGPLEGRLRPCLEYISWPRNRDSMNNGGVGTINTCWT